MTAREAANVLAAIGKEVFDAECSAERRTIKLRESFERLLKERGFDTQTKLIQQPASLCKL
jgi:hypothetical protein